MKLKFNKLKENCYFLEISNITYLISYESVIGVISENILYLNERFLKRSKTTSRHRNLLKDNLSFNNEIVLNEIDFINLVKNF